VRQHGIRTIALPAISTGIYRFPLDRATEIAVATMAEGLADLPATSATFMCFSDEALAAYRAVLEKLR
jgi:O-acetyl-ADP-ribose deacetylase (regulator of RNase III)